ncbi:hypothetical protein GF339_22485 [candidate division KSB3 bacterium]|uniref:SPOR domain-containing protein n=1 Tax=candidate division KSB3 bacterium TaxID=2044937 RepID=A0A9D5K0V9_9BACT|nr:hypothetical protein [candidate division KSB3 bacterium]MBD3327371.1 hypothetical protein [candidate division KSB3 bacterium]
MRRGSSFLGGSIIGIVVWVVFLMAQAFANPGSVTDLSEWDVTSYKVNLRDHRGGSGDIQTDQHGWIHLGANHLEGGDIIYHVQVGRLQRSDILEVWIDGYSTSNALDIGPTVFIGTGKNRFEQITRMSGDAWRPFVFRFADDAVYGDVTDPSNRNENWRIRYPSSKYETRRIDKAPSELLDQGVLPLRVSVTGAEDFIIKRIEVVVYRAQRGLYRGGLYIVNLAPAKVQRGDLVTLHLNHPLPEDDRQIEFFIIDPQGQEHRVSPRILNADRDKIGIHTETFPFSGSGRYQVKLVDLSDREQRYTDIEQFDYVRPRPKPVVQRPKQPEPVIPYPPVGLPPVPDAPPAFIVPVVPQSPQPPVIVGPPGIPGPPMMSPPSVAPAPPPTPAPPPSYAGGYTIQIGAYRVQASAVSLMQKLRGYGYDAYISEGYKGAQRLFRVRVGRYASKALANQDARRLQSSGFDTWITNLS